jgi:hypothetical protein
MTPGSVRSRSSRKWFIVAVLAAVMAAVAWVHWWQYQRASRAAAQALAFNKVEIQLTQPAFGGVATQIDAQKYSLSEPRDIVKQPDSIKLDETISLTLRPLATSGGCAPSDIDKITVALDAPAFTISPVGDASRSRSVLLASSCDLSPQPPPAPAPWRWNLLATSAGNHLITLSMQALDKNGRAADSRIIDIPVTILAQPESLSTAVGVLGGLVALLTGLIGVWQQFSIRSDNQPATPR